LRASRSQEDQAALMRRVGDAVANLTELLDQLLDLSKLEAGTVQATAQDVSLSDVLASIETQFAPLARAKGIELRLHRRDAWLHGDPLLVQRIVLNLVANAIHYTERGGVLVGARRRGERLRIEVWDTGCGIPEDRHQEVFREFVRLDRAEHRRASGLGLGLAIVARLADLLGTRIELRSRVDRGSVFAFELPAGTARQDGAVTAAGPLRAADLRGVFVLVVDDAEDSRAAMCGLLERWGCLTLAAVDGATAIAQLAAHDRPPELIVCDYRLQSVDDGLQAIAQIRAAIGEAVPAALVTAETGAQVAAEAHARGVPLLHKPVSPVKLRALLTRLLASRKTEHAA
jgi:CheY-like chemotaxis protein/two-component sensor histidine kinase